jgi:hypothetical protein
MGSAVMRPRILRPGGVLLCEFWREERGGGGDFIGGEILGEGLGFRGGASHQTDGVASMSERDSVAR